MAMRRKRGRPGRRSFKKRKTRRLKVSSGRMPGRAGFRLS